MTLNRRGALLAAFVLPAGCAIEPLAPMLGTAIPASGGRGSLRPPVVGQRWTYRKLDFFNSSVVDTVEEAVASVASTIEVKRRAGGGVTLADEIHVGWGRLLRDPAWDYPMSFETPVPLWPASLTVGARTSVRTHYRMDGGSIRYWIQVLCDVHGWERLTVSAGTFDTLRIDRLIRLEHQDLERADTVRRDSMWLAFEVGRWVAREISGQYEVAGMRQTEFAEDHFRWELTAWQ
jgi:hypothetical protein